MVIQQLPSKLRDAVCVFYLVLRGLDTVEDDMGLAQDIKLPLLREFYKKSYEECVGGRALGAGHAFLVMWGPGTSGDDGTCHRHGGALARAGSRCSHHCQAAWGL